MDDNNSSCPFCNWDKSLLIKDGKLVYVQLSNPRPVDGHLLVIPKRHIEQLSELNVEEREELLAFRAPSEVAKL